MTIRSSSRGWAPARPVVYVGAAPPPATHATVTGLLAAAQQELSVPSIAAALSPPSQMVHLTQKFALESAVGKELSQMAQSSIKSITDSVGAVATGIFKDVSSAVPFLSSVVGVIGIVWESEQAEAERRKAQAAVACYEFYTNLAPQGSASGGRVVPADLFAPYIGLSGHWKMGSPPKSPSPPGRGLGWQGGDVITPSLIVNWNSPGLHVVQDGDANNHFIGTHGTRSAIGRQLMSVTEPPIDLSVDGPYFDNPSYDKMVAAARSALKQPNLGVPSDKRLLFIKLRRAMESAWRPPYGSPLLALQRLPNEPLPYPDVNVSDGGASLLPAYLDLLATEIDQGHITQGMIEFFHNHMVVKPGGEPDHVEALGGATPMKGCSENTWRFLQNWLSTIHPSYTQDVAELAAIQKQIDDAMAKISAKTGKGGMILRPFAIARPGIGLVPVLALGAAGAAALAYFNPPLAAAVWKGAVATGATAGKYAVTAGKTVGSYASSGASAAARWISRVRGA